MENFFQYLFSGLALGTVYALVALGFVVIYRSSEVFNFAQGELLAFGALMTVTLTTGVGLPFVLALPGSMLLTGLLGVVVERVFLRPLVGRPVFVTIIVTIFVGLILRIVMLLAWGTDELRAETPWAMDLSVDIGGAKVFVHSIVAVVLGLVAVVGFALLIRYTRLGVAMRATANDQETALGLGIPVGRVFGVSWFIAGAFAALGGTFLSMYPAAAHVNLGFAALVAFPAVIVGGLDSALGAVIAGLLLGLSQVFAAGYISNKFGPFSQDFHLVFPYLLMILFLVFRPYGIFGKEKVERL